MDRGAWQVTVHGVTKSQIGQQLSCSSFIKCCVVASYRKAKKIPVIFVRIVCFFKSEMYVYFVIMNRKTICN